MRRIDDTGMGSWASPKGSFAALKGSLAALKGSLAALKGSLALRARGEFKCANDKFPFF